VRNLIDNRLDVGYVAHPSYVSSEELSAITKPLTIAAAGKLNCLSCLEPRINCLELEIDHLFSPEKRAESEKILSGLGIPWQINLYGGVGHGFALKGDLTKKEVQFATDQAFDQAVTWFKYFL
jgi:Dienelactone hydrolase family